MDSVSYNSRAKWTTVIEGGEWMSCNQHVFLAMKKTFWSSQTNDDYEMETAITWCWYTVHLTIVNREQKSLTHVTVNGSTKAWTT